jgi:rfaE bifunctional protein kinase chain/domain
MSKDADNAWLEQCLSRLSRARVAVLGDFAIDAYWLIDADESELSVETGLPVRRVRRQRYSLGGAGNVVANLAALGVRKIHAVGLIGEDLFGGLMLKMLQDLGADTSCLLAVQEGWQTPVFAKPCVEDRELNRLDFGPFNTVNASSIEAVATALDRAAKACDVVILNQQIPAGLSTPAMIERINAVIAANAQCRFIVDSRDRADLYRGAMLKLNSHEAGRLLGQPHPLDQRIGGDLARQFARRLAGQTGQAVFITRGENGIIVADGKALHEVSGIQIIERTDPVGAGDTAISAMAAVLGSGGEAAAAATLANIAASITVRKLQTTGTASPDEIRAIGPQPDYIYLPELADDPRQAHYLDGSEIERVRPLPQPLRIRHAIFDHDGTLSSLRQGWEAIMEPMMVRAILGRHYDDADEGLYHKVVQHVRVFIDKTTGIQTLSQMAGLIELVRQFGCVSESEILDIHGYKALYNEKLLEMVSSRVGKLRRGELSTEDFQIKGAHKLLEALHSAGVKLYLASGTDQADVVAEAEAMGYAHLFEGRIFGAVGDINIEAKRVVLERIIREHRLGGAELATFGDGPVEMRETRKRGGVAVGVASDEIRRFGLCPAKRTRLIRAGADLVVPDFSQLAALLATLGLK